MLQISQITLANKFVSRLSGCCSSRLLKLPQHLLYSIYSWRNKSQLNTRRFLNNQVYHIIQFHGCGFQVFENILIQGIGEVVTVK
jgi:hypothetical protein